jgi:hypothetical protein
MKNYCIKRNLTTINFINTINNSFSYDDVINLNVVKNNLIKLSILDDEEASYLTKVINEYKNEKITLEFLACLIDDQLRDQLMNKKVDIRKFYMPKDEHDLEDYLNEEDLNNNNNLNDEDYEYN